MATISVHRRRLVHNLFIAFINVLFVYALVSGGALDVLLAKFQTVRFATMFAGGFFFTSLFTTGPAILLLGKLALEQSLWQVVLVGAMGAVCGDLILFRIVKDAFAEDLSYVLSIRKHKRLYHLLHTRLVRHLWPLIGGFIIASPLPDELGIALLGIGRLKTRYFIPISFCFNALGILLIGLAARAF